MTGWLWWWALGFVIVITLHAIFGAPPDFITGLVVVCAVGALVGLVIGVIRGRDA